MAEHNITLTDAEENAFVEMLGSNFDLEAYVKSLASSHIKQQLDEQWAELTDEEKQSKLE